MTGPGREAAIDLCLGVDLMIHDAQFLDAEDAIAEDYGHSTISQAIELAAEAHVAELVLFHHGPGRTDAALDEIINGVQVSGLEVSMAIEGVERVPGGSAGVRLLIPGDGQGHPPADCTSS